MLRQQRGLRVTWVWAAAIVFCATAALAAAAPEDEPYVGPADTKQAPAAAADGNTGPLRLSLQGAILTSLAHNRDLRVQLLQPAITRTLETAERAVFDPVAGGTVSVSRTRNRTATSATSRNLTAETAGEVYLEEFLPTGTTIRAEGSTSSAHSSLYADHFTATRAGITVTQALLRGMPVSVNLARLHQARLDTLISEYELRGFVEALVAKVEESYWEYALTLREVEIVRESKEVAAQHLRETGERVNVGKISEAELAAAEAEVALRQEALIDAEATNEKARLSLLRLVSPAGGAIFDHAVTLSDGLASPAGKLDEVTAHVAVALRLRSDLNQARLSLKRGALEVVRTKNGLLPKLDFFLTLGATGYNDTFGGSVRKMDGPHYDASAGLTLEYPLLNREARATYRGAVLSHRQQTRAIDNLAQLVELDVRTACVETHRAQAKVAATATTSTLRAESLRAETEKFKVGKSTSFLVASAQSDLLESRLKEVRAVMAHLQALTDLYRLEGSLLERRGILAPGRPPVATPAAGE